MKEYITVDRPEDCCGCGGCLNVCSKNAITMQADAAGFVYPAVDEQACVRCGRCVNVCAFTQPGKGAHGEAQVYAAAVRDQKIRMESSSGGLFTALATAVLKKGGAVFGAAFTDALTVAHRCVTDAGSLSALRGSKYVQSDTGDTFRQVRALLREGRLVCYSGTPCQIAGLKAYLGEDSENLLTVDIVCHGVPSLKMLRDDLEYCTGGKLDAIESVKFRDKRYGWGTKGSVVYGGKTLKYTADTSPYYFYFLKGEVYRESCYRCRFPSEGRQGDITLGDYWGVRQALLDQMGGIDPELGVSCVLVNSEKGKQWLDSIADSLALAPSDRPSVEKRNGQLTHASTPLSEHTSLLCGYIRDGHAAFRSHYKKHLKDHLVRTAKNMVPSKIKRRLNERLASR